MGLTQEQIKAIVDSNAHSADDELGDIVERLGTKYGIDGIVLNDVDLKRLGLFLCDIQRETLRAGIKIGIDIGYQVLHEANKAFDS